MVLSQVIDFQGTNDLKLYRNRNVEQLCHRDLEFLGQI
jgi:hypothetical protein